MSSTFLCDCWDFFSLVDLTVSNPHIAAEKATRLRPIWTSLLGRIKSDTDGQGFISLTWRRGGKLIGIFTFCQHCVGSSNTGVKQRVNSFPPPTLAAQEKLQRPALKISAKWIWKDESLICLNFACAVYFHAAFPTSSANSFYFPFHHHFQVQKVPVSVYLCLGE